MSIVFLSVVCHASMPMEAAVIVTDEQLLIKGQLAMPIEPREPGDTKTSWDEWLREHPDKLRKFTANGLLADIDAKGMRQHDVEWHLRDFVEDALSPVAADGSVGPPPERFGCLVSAGSVKLLDPQLFDSRLSVSSLWTMAERWGDFGGAPSPLDSGRALGDAHDGLAITGWFRSRYLPR